VTLLAEELCLGLGESRSQIHQLKLHLVINPLIEGLASDRLTARIQRCKGLKNKPVQQFSDLTCEASISMQLGIRGSQRRKEKIN
jgi:hypothetical protein